MKLYYSPGACSLSPHIVLRELGFQFDLERVDTSRKTTANGADFRKINPKGYVPALTLDDGEVLTEGAAIVQYLADRKPEARLAPPAGTLERARLQEHLNYLASELHKAYSPLFQANASEEAKQAAVTNVGRRLDYLDGRLADGRAYLLGDVYTVGDPYLFVLARWAGPTGIALAQWRHLDAFCKRIAGRDAVRAAMHAEGLGGATHT